MPTGTIFFRYRLHHVLFWMLLFAVWFLLRRHDYPSTGTALLVTFVKVIDLVILVYVTNYVLLPKLFYKKKYFQFFLLFVFMILGSSLLKMQVLGRILNSPRLLDFAGNWSDRLYDNIIPHFFLVIAG